MDKIYLDRVFMAVLIGGCVVHPASAAVGLLVFLVYQTSERYFTRNVSDQAHKDLELVKTEVAKLKLQQQASDLGKAFGAR